MKRTYENIAVPNLDKIERWVTEGATDKEISENLGVSYSAYRNWCHQGCDNGIERYKELAAVYARAKIVPDREVEASLYKLANGYTVEVKRAIKIRHTEYDPQTGKKVKEWETIETAPEQVHVQANVNAQMFYLANRVPDKWRYQGKIENKSDKDGKEDVSGVVILPEIDAPSDAADVVTETVE
jgi:transposase